MFRFLTIPFYQYSIEPGEASTIFGASFGLSGWHHIIKTLEQYEANTNLDYRETSLYRYLKDFKPNSICEMLDENHAAVCKLPLFVYPWGTFRKNEFTSSKDPMNSRFCGPSDDSFIQEEYDRIIKLYKTLKISGYKPWNAYNSFIGGTMLVNGDGQKRFVVLQGNHRLAIMSFLGIKKLKVRNVSGYLSQISLEKLMSSTNLIDTCDNESTEKIFSLFFRQDGWHISKYLEKVND